MSSTCNSVPPADARGVVEAYLEEAYRLGLTALRIIHGRGIGVQRAMVRAVLEATPFVDSFCDAPAEAGGWGATIVTLKPGITLKPGGTGSESGQSGPPITSIRLRSVVPTPSSSARAHGVVAGLERRRAGGAPAGSKPISAVQTESVQTGLVPTASSSGRAMRAPGIQGPSPPVME